MRFGLWLRRCSMGVECGAVAVALARRIGISASKTGEVVLALCWDRMGRRSACNGFWWWSSCVLPGQRSKPAFRLLIKIATWRVADIDAYRPPRTRPLPHATGGAAGRPGTAGRLYRIELHTHTRTHTHRDDTVANAANDGCLSGDHDGTRGGRGSIRWTRSPV